GLLPDLDLRERLLRGSELGQVQVALLLLGPVALDAELRDERNDLILELARVPLPPLPLVLGGGRREHPRGEKGGQGRRERPHPCTIRPGARGRLTRPRSEAEEEL